MSPAFYYPRSAGQQQTPFFAFAYLSLPSNPLPFSSFVSSPAVHKKRAMVGKSNEASGGDRGRSGCHVVVEEGRVVVVC